MTEPTERLFGSEAFRGRGRNLKLTPPAKFIPTPKSEGDVVLTSVAAGEVPTHVSGEGR